MKKVTFLREVTSVGQGRIPRTVYLAETLTEVGLENVKTYVQSGNIVFETILSDDDVCALIRDVIQVKIGADLSVILKAQVQFAIALAESPFDEGCDDSRAHLVFVNDQFNQGVLSGLLEMDLGAEILRTDSERLCLYSSREAKKKQLNTNYLEKQLYIMAIMRKYRSIL